MILAFKELNDHCNDNHTTSKEVKLKELTSNKPRSLNFRDGITNKAINDKVIKGALKLLPISFAMASSSAYAFPIISAGLSLIIPATGRATTFSVVSFIAHIPPLFLIKRFTALQIKVSEVPTTIIL